MQDQDECIYVQKLRFRTAATEAETVSRAVRNEALDQTEHLDADIKFQLAVPERSSGCTFRVCVCCDNNISLRLSALIPSIAAFI